MQRLDSGLSIVRATGDESSQKIAQKIAQLLQTGIADLQDAWTSTLSERSAQIEPLAFVIKNQPLPAFTREQVSFLSAIARFAATESHLKELRNSLRTSFTSMRSTFMQKSLYTFVLASQRNLEIRTSNLYDKESNGIGHYTEAIMRMSQSERSLCVVLFGEVEGPEIHHTTVGAAFADYISAIKAMIGHIRGRINTDCYLGFEALENMNKLERIIKDIEMPEVARDLHGNTAALAGLSASSFHELSEDLKRRGSALVTLPPDASVCDVTKEFCVRTKRFLDYPQVVSQLLLALGEGGWQRPVSSPIRVNPAAGDKGLPLFDSFSAELIESLLQILEQKARTIHKRLNMVAVFMLNNASYIQTAILRSEMSRYLSGKCINRIEDSNKRALKMYRESWDVSARQLMDTTIMRPADSKSSRNSLTSKDRDAVKERFKIFNTEFDESIRACKGFNVLDADLRQVLTGEIRSVIVPLYSRFHDKYVNTDFTKNKEKYIKYSKESIEKAIWDAFS